jgi:hypothetical protein
MAPSPSLRKSRTSSPPVTPTERSRRALAYWHKHGRFIFDEPGYDAATCTVCAMPVSQPTPAQAHTSTPAQPHICTSTLKEVDTYTTEKTEYASEEDLGGTPYFLRGDIVADREMRESLGITAKDYGTRWQSAYRTLLGPRPECGPGDRSAAGLFWMKIRQALKQGGWTPGEWGRLYALERKWRKRRNGEDPRFEVMGTSTGRPSPGQAKEIHDRKVGEDMRKIAKGAGGGA